jgi:aspartate aminotransferase
MGTRMLAQRTSLFSASGTAQARSAARAAAATGKEIIDLSAGEIWCEPPEAVRSGAISAIEQGINRYTDTIGLEALREAVAKKLAAETGHAWAPDEVAVTAGGKQALFNAAMTILNPGDEVIIPAPYWTTFPAQALLAGATPVFIETRTNGYAPLIQNIRAAVTPATRAIVVNTPGNPTGAVFDRALLAGIAELAIRQDLWIVFDECYRSFVYEPNNHDNIIAIVPQVRGRTLVVNSFSKTLAMTGWRVGYLAGPKEAIAAVKALQSHTTSNPNVIAQHAVLAHLRSGNARFEQNLLSRLSLSRARGLEILSRLTHVPLPSAQGGFYFYLDLSDLLAAKRRGRTVAGADDFARMLLEEAGVAAVSGTAFGDPAGLRLSYGVPLDKLERGLCAVVSALNALTAGRRSAA